MGVGYTSTRFVRHCRRRDARAVHGVASGHGAHRARARQRAGHRGTRQDGRGRGSVRDRLRHDPQQLFPARHARAHGAQRIGLGIGPRRLFLPPGRFPADGARGHARGRGADPHRAAGDRLRLRPGRGRAGLPRLHARDVPRLAGGGRHHRAARETGRVRQQQALAGRARGQAAGPWIRDFWAMLGLPDRVDVTDATGTVYPDRPMSTYWALQEGTLEVDPGAFTTATGGFPPVVHVDSDAPLLDDIDGELITDQMWGIYFKPDFDVGGVKGGAAPYIVDRPARDVAVDPYGPASPEFVVGEDFTRMWTSGLAHSLKRFENQRHLYRKEPSGGIGAFTPDSFPVFDTFRQNAYVIADS